MTSELGKIRAAHRATLSATCAIWRKTSSATSAGGVENEWAEAAAELPCRVMPEYARRMVDQVAGRESAVNYYRLTLPFDSDLRADDRIHYQDEVYEVVMIWDQHDLRSAIRAIIAKVN